jgi:hypothetical protein
MPGWNRPSNTPALAGKVPALRELGARESALLGVGARAMDTGRDTLHLVFTVQLHLF